MAISSHLSTQFQEVNEETLSLEAYLELCQRDSMAYANTAERLLKAIGEPLPPESASSMGNTLYAHKPIKKYAVFSEFFGLDESINQIVAYLQHAAQGLEEKNQILYLLGPVGGGKSSLAEKLKTLMSKYPIYCLAGSPVFESPLGLFSATHDAKTIHEKYGIPKRYLKTIPSPWAVKRLSEYHGDIHQFKVIKLYPDKLKQIAISKTEPGDEHHQDISALVGKINIRLLDEYDQNDPDAYSYSGGLCLANQGLLEFVEMFKAPIKVLHPLLTATQEHHYNATEGLSPLPFQGLILAHSNESEWQAFRNNKRNEAFIDRIYVVKIPYVLRAQAEVKIYQKLLNNSALIDAPCTPMTLELLAQFMVLSRIKAPEHANIYTKMKVYDGDNMRDIDPKAKSIYEYQHTAGPHEGMTGLSPRFAFKVLAKVFNYPETEISANPVHLFTVLEHTLTHEQLSDDLKETYLSYIKEYLVPEYLAFLNKEIHSAYLVSFDDYAQNIFERYVTHADYWLQNREYRDPRTGVLLNRDSVNLECEKIEKPAGILNSKDFREEIVSFVLHTKAQRQGAYPNWQQYKKMQQVIERKLFANTEELLPVLSLDLTHPEHMTEAQQDFARQMQEKGYTDLQISTLTDWYLQVRQSH